MKRYVFLMSVVGVSLVFGIGCSGNIESRESNFTLDDLKTASKADDPGRLEQLCNRIEGCSNDWSDDARWMALCNFLHCYSGCNVNDACMDFCPSPCPTYDCYQNGGVCLFVDPTEDPWFACENLGDPTTNDIWYYDPMAVCEFFPYEMNSICCMPKNEPPPPPIDDCYAIGGTCVLVMPYETEEEACNREAMSWLSFGSCYMPFTEEAQNNAPCDGEYCYYEYFTCCQPNEPPPPPKNCYDLPNGECAWINYNQNPYSVCADLGKVFYAEHDCYWFTMAKEDEQCLLPEGCDWPDGYPVCCADSESYQYDCYERGGTCVYQKPGQTPDEACSEYEHFYFYWPEGACFTSFEVYCEEGTDCGDTVCCLPGLV